MAAKKHNRAFRYHRICLALFLQIDWSKKRGKTSYDGDLKAAAHSPPQRLGREGFSLGRGSLPQGEELPHRWGYKDKILTSRLYRKSQRIPPSDHQGGTMYKIHVTNPNPNSLSPRKIATPFTRTHHQSKPS